MQEDKSESKFDGAVDAGSAHSRATMRSRPMPMALWALALLSLLLVHIDGQSTSVRHLATTAHTSDSLCADKAASNFDPSAIDDIPSSSTGAVSRNAGCDYTEASLARAFSAPGPTYTPRYFYIDRKLTTGAWPPPLDSKKENTFVASVGTTVVQGYSSADGLSRTRLESRAEAHLGAWLVLRHVEMAGLSAVAQPNYLYYKLGGAVYVDQGRLTVEYTIFRDNYADYAGGAIGLFEANPIGGSAMVTGCIFINNTALGRDPCNGGCDSGGYGGAISQEHAGLQILSSAFYDNRAKQGGAVSVDTEQCSQPTTASCKNSFRQLVVSNCTGSGNAGGTKEALSIFVQTQSLQRRTLTDSELYINLETMWAYVSLTPAGSSCDLDPLPLHTIVGSCAGNVIPDIGCVPRCDQHHTEVPSVAILASCADEELASVGMWKGTCALDRDDSSWFQVTWWALACFIIAVASSLTLPFFMCRFWSKLDEVEQTEHCDEDDASDWPGALMFVHGVLDIFSDVGLCLSTTGCQEGFLFLASLISLLLPAIASLILTFTALATMESGNADAANWHRRHNIGVVLVIIASCMRIESLSILRLRLSYVPDCIGRIDFPGMTAKHYNFVRFSGGYRAVVTDIPHMLVGIAMLHLAGEGTCTDDHWWLSLLPGDPAHAARYCAIVNIVFSSTSIFWGFVSRVAWSIQNKALDLRPQRLTDVVESIQKHPQSEEIIGRLLSDDAGISRGRGLESFPGAE